MAKFQYKYSGCGYQFGFGSYGLPVVHDWKEGASLRIGKFCSIAEGVNIFLGGNHRDDWISTFPFPAFYDGLDEIVGYGFSKGDVIIGNDVWICTGATILSGVTIGDGAIVAADAVVSRDVEPYAVVAGNPSRVVRYRFSEQERDKLLEIEWWNWDEERIQAAIPLLCTGDLFSFFKFCDRA